MNETIIKCPNCGSENLSTYDKCLSCGAILEKNIKKERNFNEKKIIPILNLIVGIFSIVCFILSCINSYKIINDGLPVVGKESGEVFVMCIIECFVPIIYLIAGILCLIKRKNAKKSFYITLIILYIINAIIAFVPISKISDIFYMITGVNNISLLSICAIMNIELLLFTVHNLLINSFKNKKVKVTISIVFTVVAIIMLIILLNVLAPSEYLLSD